MHLIFQQYLQGGSESQMNSGIAPAAKSGMAVEKSPIRLVL